MNADDIDRWRLGLMNPPPPPTGLLLTPAAVEKAYELLGTYASLLRSIETGEMEDNIAFAIGQAVTLDGRRLR